LYGPLEYVPRLVLSEQNVKKCNPWIPQPTIGGSWKDFVADFRQEIALQRRFQLVSSHKICQASIRRADCASHTCELPSVNTFLNLCVRIESSYNFDKTLHHLHIRESDSSKQAGEIKTCCNSADEDRRMFVDQLGASYLGQRLR